MCVGEGVHLAAFAPEGESRREAHAPRPRLQEVQLCHDKMVREVLHAEAQPSSWLAARQAGHASGAPGAAFNFQKSTHVQRCWPCRLRVLVQLDEGSATGHVAVSLHSCVPGRGGKESFGKRSGKKNCLKQHRPVSSSDPLTFALRR